MKTIIECPYCKLRYTTKSRYRDQYTCPDCGAKNDTYDVVDFEFEKRSSESDHNFSQNQESYLSFLWNFFKDNFGDFFLHMAPFLFVVAIVLIADAIPEYDEKNDNFESPVLNTIQDYQTSEYYQELKQQEYIAGNSSAESYQIQLLIKDLLTATGEENYDTILPYIYGYDKYPWITDAQWISHYRSSFWGKYIGNTDICYTECRYIEGYPTVNSYGLLSDLNIAPFLVYEFKLSDDTTKELTFRQNTLGDWTLDVYTSGLLEDVEIWIPYWKKNGTAEPILLSVNGFSLEKEYSPTVKTTEDGATYSVYTLPALIPGWQELTLETPQNIIVQSNMITSARGNVILPHNNDEEYTHGIGTTE